MAAVLRTKRASWPVHSLIYAGIAYIVATIFLLPYIEMIISAVRPASQMLDRDFLPSRFNAESFIDIWSTGFGNNLRISLEVAGGSTILVLLGGDTGCLLHRPPALPRSRRLHAAGAGDADVPADGHAGGHLPGSS